MALAHCPDTQAASRATAECTEGFSLLPLVPMLDSPKAPPTKPAWKREAAHSQFPRSCGKHAPCKGNALSLDFGVMGYTQRLDKYRYVRPKPPSSICVHVRSLTCKESPSQDCLGPVQLLQRIAGLEFRLRPRAL